MKYSYIFSFIMLCLLFAGCKEQTKHSTEVYTIDFVQGFETKQQMLISEIADKVEYIELKTPEEIIITGIRTVIPFENYLIVQAKNRVYLFHRDGQFISSIGNIGQGPGEYITAMDACIDKKRREIVVTGIDQVLHYDLNGNYLRKQLAGVYGFNIEISDSILWLGENIYSINNKYQAIAFSLNGSGDTIANIPNSAYGAAGSDDAGSDLNHYSRFFYRKNDSLYFNGEVSNDTVRRISGTNTVPHAFIDMGRYKLPLEFERWVSKRNFDKNSENYWGVSTIVEDDNYFFLLALDRKYKWISPDIRLRYIVYDKKTKKGFAANDKNDMGITDDITGGPPVWPRWASEDYYINAIEAHELLEKVESGDYSPSPQLEELLSRIGDDTNQLIVLCHKKK